MILKQSTTYTRAFLMVKNSDHITGSTGQSTQISLVMFKGASTSSSTAAATISELNFGWYNAAFTAADTNTLGDLAIHATSSSGTCDPTDWVDQVQTTIFTDLVLNGSGRAQIANNLQQNTATSGFLFPMTNAVGGALMPGLTVTAQRTLGAGGFSACANSPSEVGGAGASGIYSINLAASDLNSATVGLLFTAAGANTLFVPVVPTP